MQLRSFAIVMVLAALLGACGDDAKSEGDKDAGMDAGKEPVIVPKKDSAVPVPTVECKEMPECTAPPVDIQGFLGPDNKDLADLAAGLGSAGLSGFGLSSDPCCTEPGGKCGVSSAMLTAGECVEQNQEGKADEVCTDFAIDLAAAGGAGLSSMLPTGLELKPIKLKGCCRPDNKCGLELGGLGVGCVERTAASTFAAMGASMVDAGGVDAGVKPLEEIKCVFDPSTGSDGGADDAGATN